MFRNVMIPVDFNAKDRMAPVFALAAKLADPAGGRLHLVHVGAYPPSRDGHTAEEQDARLREIGDGIADAHGLPVETHNIIVHDPAAELNAKLLAATKEIGADLVVVGSHVPVLGDYFFTSHGGYLAEHASVSVFVVRNT